MKVKHKLVKVKHKLVKVKHKLVKVKWKLNDLNQVMDILKFNVLTCYKKELRNLDKCKQKIRISSRNLKGST